MGQTLEERLGALLAGLWPDHAWPDDDHPYELYSTDEPPGEFDNSYLALEWKGVELDEVVRLSAELLPRIEAVSTDDAIDTHIECIRDGRAGWSMIIRVFVSARRCPQGRLTTIWETERARADAEVVEVAR